MECHQCGACCTEISISTSYVGHPNGKKAGTRCIWLEADNKCLLFNKPLRPAICSSFQADPEICGTNGEEATKLIRWYEKETRP
ncbi:YkgJ family cysteine cluster protein [Burkholderia phage vB_BpP_HN04]|uniref:YkgJ family cysteine cluster protein n=1 Tax=Burkholderia phage vB_BpP_HN02 TaxID=3116925 RepID=A0AAX4JGX1_9CAUD|nr:YkgJ family cysteine cluster protein [Burkholderia phage vB_BpP_HN01]